MLFTRCMLHGHKFIHYHTNELWRLYLRQQSFKSSIALRIAVILLQASAKSSSGIQYAPDNYMTMAFTVLSAVFVCLTALTFSGYINAYPQQLFPIEEPQQKFEPISEICLGCICDSISSCNRNLTCEGDVCGMFRITWAYWADSGKPVVPGDNPNDGLAYARCTNDPMCARQSVVNYVSRFAQDCNGDGAIDCLDYASIHKLGGFGCSAPLDPEYKRRYNSCQKAVYELSGSPGAQNSNVIFNNPTVPPPEQQNFNQ